MEQQACTISELRVEAEADRRRQRGQEQALAAAQGEHSAAQADVAALLGQLRAAEGAANAAEGELGASETPVIAACVQFKLQCRRCNTLDSARVASEAALCRQR